MGNGAFVGPQKGAVCKVTSIPNWIILIFGEKHDKWAAVPSLDLTWTPFSLDLTTNLAVHELYEVRSPQQGEEQKKVLQQHCKFFNMCSMVYCMCRQDKPAIAVERDLLSWPGTIQCLHYHPEEWNQICRCLAKFRSSSHGSDSHPYFLLFCGHVINGNHPLKSEGGRGSPESYVSKSIVRSRKRTTKTMGIVGFRISDV